MILYRCVATSLAGFVQQVATAYLPHGYWFYCQGFVPEGKNPEAIDAKLIAKYGAALSKWQRARRKRGGHANLQYVRLGSIFLLMATKGVHPFFEEEAATIRDARKVPIRIGGYSISVRKGPDGRLHSHVRIDRAPYAELMARYLERCSRLSTARLVSDLYHLPYEPYAPVRRQYLMLLRRINAVRKEHGRQTIPVEALPLRRRIVRPFEADARDPNRAPEGEAIPPWVSGP